MPRGYKGLVSGELGELEHGILLEQYVGKPEAQEIAPHWRGCRFELRENKKLARVVLLYAVEWDDEPAPPVTSPYTARCSPKSGST